MKVLLVGAGGQLGEELRLACPQGIDLVAATHPELDVRSLSEVLSFTAQCAPSVIINAAAYTAVDGAESRPDLAEAVNAEGPGYLARAAERCAARMLQISTDFVFDGQGRITELSPFWDMDSVNRHLAG